MQALIRGFLLRKRISDRFAKFHDNVDKIIKIQKWWRKISNRSSLRDFIDDEKEKLFIENEDKVDNKPECNNQTPYDWYKKNVRE